jgi:tRNA threonylcarbamoyl adenosine modification protein (Sua5/YciO/YrdC/YwlC family)
MLVRVNNNNISANSISQIVNCLKAGGIIIYPTDTVYALGCDMSQIKAIEKICKLKGIRPENSNFSFVCSDLSHLSEYTKPIPNTIFRAMKKTLPGPFTFILEANNLVPKLLKQNKKTVGIRVPDNSICKAIVEALGNPIISSSLIDNNDEIVEYYSDPELIFERYNGIVDLIVDGGYGNIFPSTIVNCSQGEIEIIREGLGDPELLA